MPKLLNFRVLLMCALFMTSIFINDAKSQVTEIEYQIRYNDQDCIWDFYIIIAEGSANNPLTRAQFNAQYSFVVPTGTSVSTPIGHNPIEDNQTYTGTVPTTWSFGSPVFNPAASPGNDFYPVSPALNPTSFFNDLAEGDTVKIFSIDIGIAPNCADGIRIFDNVNDPGSNAPGMGGGNFSNGYTLGGPIQLYNGNLPTVVPPPPVVSGVNLCTSSTEIDIDLTATTSVCQEPLSYSWSGPNGFTSNDEDVSLDGLTAADEGTYTVTVTDNFGCESVFTIEGELKPDAGLDTEGCASSSTSLSASPTTGTWSMDMTNPLGSTLNPGAAGAATVDFDATAIGDYTYIYTGEECSDSVVISIVAPDAGPDPADLTCFSSGAATLSAVGTGTWSIGAGSAGTAMIADPSSANTTVSNFSVSGTYFLVWDIGACSDTVTIITNDNCDCAISNNLLSPVDPNAYCGTSGNILIDGGEVSASGSYAWEYSLDGGAFSAANGTNDEEDYTTDDLTEGSHSFRRLYTTDSGIICSDTSNVVSFMVTANPDAPADLMATDAEICENETTTVSVTNVPGVTYTWDVTPNGSGAFLGSSNFIDLDPFLPGVYTVSVFATVNDCPSPTVSMEVTVNEVPLAPDPNDIVGTDPTICEFDDGFITISGYTPSVNYEVSYDFEGSTFITAVTTDASGEFVIPDLGAGTYTNFQIISAQGCISEVEPGPVTLSDPEAPNNPTGLTPTPNPECLGLPITITVDDVPGATYSWSASSPDAGLGMSTTNTVEMNATAPGIYNVFVNLTLNGCTSIDTFTSIQVNDAPPAPTDATVSGTDPGACGANDGFITLSGYDASTAYDVTYSTNGTPSTISVNSTASGDIIIPDLTEGTYSDFSVTNFTGCSSGIFPGPISLADPGSPDAPANLTALPNPVCFGTEINLSVDDTAGATFNWSASSPEAGLGTSTGSSNTLNPTVAGTYTVSVSVTVAGCTSMSSSVEVVVNETPPTPSNVVGTDPTTCSGTDGFITLPGYNANETYSVVYFVGGSSETVSITADGSGTIIISGLTAGTYSDIIVFNAADCPSDNFAGPIDLVDPSAPDAPTNLSGMPNPICAGETVTLSVDEVADATYTWSVSPADVGFDANNTNEITFTPTADGIFVVSVNLTIAGCTSAASSPYNVIVSETPDTPVEADISFTNPMGCQGSDGTIIVSGLAPNVSYGVQLDSAMITISRVESANSSGELTIPGLSSGSYTNIILTNDIGCSSGAFAGPVVLSDPGAPEAPEGIMATPNPSCLGTEVTLSVIDNPDAEYTWSSTSINAGLISVDNNMTTMTATMPGTYTVFVTQSIMGCASAPAMIDVTVIDIPPTPDASTVVGVSPTDCTTDNGTITISGLDISTSYDLTYSTDGTPSTSNFMTNASGEIVITGLGSGVYADFSVTNAQGCSSGVFAGPVTLLAPESPEAPTGVGNDPSACGVSDGSILVSNLEASATISLTYSFNGSATTISVTTNAAGEVTITDLAAGEYTDFSYVNTEGCTSEVFAGPISLVEPAAPSAPTVSGTDPSDCGLSDGSIVVGGLPSSVMNTVSYSFNGTPTTVMLMANASGEITITGLASGDYTNFSFVTAAGCTSGVFLGPVTLSEPSAPSAPTAIGTNPLDCGISNGSIELSGFEPSSTNSITYSFNGTSTTVMLMANADGEVTISSLAAGNYTDFSFVTQVGCTSGVFPGPVMLSEPNAPAAPTGLEAMPNPVCLGETIDFNVDMVSGATYTWMASSTDAGLVDSSTPNTTMTATQAGTYTISVSLTIAGCQSNPVSIEVEVNPLPDTPDAANITSTDPTSCTTDDGTITISGYDPTTDYDLTYSYNGGLPVIVNVTTDAAGNILLEDLPAGSYTAFSLIDENGCMSGTFTGSIDLIQPGAPAAPIGVDGLPNPVCLGNTVDLIVDANPLATFEWSVNTPTAGLISGTGNTATLDPTAAGIITVSVTQTITGCQSPPALISILVLENCLNPDFGVTYNNITLDGDLSTNDIAVAGVTYGDPVAIGVNPTPELPMVSTDGTYTFSTTTVGEWYFNVEVCNSAIAGECYDMPLAITVLDVESTENAPVGNHDYIHSLTNTPIPLNVLSNDKCQSFPNCEVEITDVTAGPFFGTFDLNTQMYVPNSGFVGRDSFMYEICQTPMTPESCDEEWVYIEIFPGFATHFTNAMDDYNQTALNSELSVAAEDGLMANDSDPASSMQTVTPADLNFPGRGSIVINADGSYVFTPETDYFGPVYFEYQTCRIDNNSICDNATLHLLVEPLAAAGVVGSCVWEDTNGNGIFEGGEPPVANVPVRLFNSDGDLVQETTTDATGNYLFEDVLLGIYFLEFETIDEFEFTLPNIGSDNNDSDVDDTNGPGTTTQFTVLAGQSIDNFKAGLFNCTKIGNNVWYDVNENDIFDPLENGINGMQVQLWRRVNGQWILWDETTTGQKPNSPSDDGYFEFCTAPGEYYVKVILPPTGLVQARPFVGNDITKDSDINNANGPGTTNSFNLVNGVDKTDLGAGYYPEAVVGNLVWFDENFDGLQGDDEPRVEGVLVEVIDVESSKVIGSSITNAEGVYSIDSLDKRDVYFKFTTADALVATIPGIGNNDIDSDVDHSFGLNTTGIVSLKPNSTDNRIDFGLAFGALPVRWLDVNASRIDDAHLVNWKVDQEINVDEYVVLRRHESESELYRINDLTIKSNNVLSQSEYSFIDNTVDMPGIYYYQIQQFDKDGKFNFSKTVSIESELKLETSLYPNPTSGISTLAFETVKDGEVLISVTDVSGQIITEFETSVIEGANAIEIDMTNYLPGAYNVTLNVNGTIVNKRLMKIK